MLEKGISQKALNFAQTYIFGIWFALILLDPFPRLAELPPELFKPAGLLWLGIPRDIEILLLNSFFLWGLKIATAASLLSVILRKKPGVAAAISCLLLTLLQSILLGFGHMSNSQLPLLYSAYFLSIPFFFKRPSHHEEIWNAAPVFASLFFLLLTYSFAGIHRMLQGVDVFFDDTLRLFVFRNILDLSSPFPNNRLILEFAMNPYGNAFLQCGFMTVTFFEIVAPLTLISKTLRILFLLLMIPFHFLSFVMLNVFFWENVCLFVFFLVLDHRSLHIFEEK